MKITTHTTRTTEEQIAFGASGEDVRSQEYDFDDAQEVIDFLTKEGIQSPSSYPVMRINVPNIWLASLDPYEHPEGYREEVTAHRGEGIDDDTWAHILKEAVWPQLMDRSDL